MPGDQCRAAALPSNPVCHAGFGGIDHTGRSADFSPAGTIFVRRRLDRWQHPGTLRRRLVGAAAMDSKADLC
jgi:hypothetical protein